MQGFRLSTTCLALATVMACGSPIASIANAELGRLAARPHSPRGQCVAGLHRLALTGRRDAVLYVPQASRQAWPLFVLLHGAGGAPERIVEGLRPTADAHGVVLLAPASLEATWDGIRGEPRVDVQRIDDALKAAFDRCAVIDGRIAIGGFSDGASYAITLGTANGDLLSHIIAFSPCVMSSSIDRRGRPRVFISHGRHDDILPFSPCGQAIATRLKRDGYSVTFEPFDGRHAIPTAVANAAFTWFISAPTERQ